jgi:phosphoribosylaminoimidazole (AIR) synthetase
MLTVTRELRNYSVSGSHSNEFSIVNKLLEREYDKDSNLLNQCIVSIL